MTPDENPILDSHPGRPGLVVGAGFSGTGFKLAPVFGEMLAELATGKMKGPKSAERLEHFRASRFRQQ